MPRQTTLDLLRDARKAATFDLAGFSNIGPEAQGDEALPADEHRVDTFIKARTRIYRQTWILPQLDTAIARLELQSLKPEARKILEAAWHDSMRAAGPAAAQGVDYRRIFPHPFTQAIAAAVKQLDERGLVEAREGRELALRFITPKGRELLDTARRSF